MDHPDRTRREVATRLSALCKAVKHTPHPFRLSVIPTAKIASPELRVATGNARWRVILNGKVAGNPIVRAAIGALRESGRVVEVRVTWEQGDAQRFTAEATP